MLPHLPWCPPKKYWDLYDPKTLALAANDRTIRGVPDTEMGTNYELSHYADSIDFPTPTGGKVSEEKARLLIHGYLASVSFVDAQVGLVLAALEQQGLADNTIVVLWSDHGYKLGEHNGWGKMTNLEIDCRIPLIIRDPRAKANGKRCTRLVESIDLFPTLCERSGVPVPGGLEGKSMARLLDDPAAKHSDAAFSQYVYAPLMGNSVRTPEWRYTEWFDMESGAIRHRILYDHRADHSENQNVIGEHPAVADQLQKQLHAVLPNQATRLLPPIHSSAGGERTAVTFVNRHPGTVRLTWIPPNGCRAEGQDIAPGKSQRSTTFFGHVFVAESLDGKYQEIITIESGREEILLGPDK